MLRLVLDTQIWLDWLVFDDPGVRLLRDAVQLGRAEICIDDACHTRSGLAGMSKWLIPSGLRASTMAFITEVIDPAQPASPQPFAPSGLVVAGTGWLAQSIDARMSSARGSA